MTVYVSRTPTTAVEFFRAAIEDKGGEHELAGDNQKLSPILAAVIMKAVATSASAYDREFSQRLIWWLNTPMHPHKYITRATLTFIDKQTRERPYHYQLNVTFVNEDSGEVDLFIAQIYSDLLEVPHFVARMKNKEVAVA